MVRLANGKGSRAGAALIALATVASGLAALVAAAGAAWALPAISTFSNTTALTIADPSSCVPIVPGKANVYPSNITVSGLTGTVSNVTVTFTGVTHTFEGDLEALVASPAGGSHNIEVLSDAGTGALSNATVTFDDAGSGLAPQNTAWGPGTYKPTNYTELSPPAAVDTFPSPAPAPSANTTMAGAFNGTDPNGTWSLYLLDDGCGDTGSFSGGWSIAITTSAGAATTTSVSSSPNPSRTGQNVVFTATVTSGGSPVSTGTVTFTEGATVLAAGVAVNGSGVATANTSTLVEGDHLITATYNANASFNTSSGTVDQRVDNNTTVNGLTFCNTGAITIPGSGVIGNAFPYGSNIFVTGVGNLATVTATLKNVSHTFDGDIDALLVGPTGHTIVIVSDAGTAAISNVTVTLDDTAASLLPSSGAWAAPNATISSKPTDYVELAADSWPAPAPAPSSDTTFGAAFAGTDANGTWSLYIVDDGAPDTGSVAGGWCLNFTQAKATPIIATQASAGGPVGTQVSDTATVSGGSSPTGTVTFNLFSDNVCTTQVFTSNNNLSGSNATSGTFTTTAAGTYYWTATYSGDANNNAATSACNATNESVVITKATPTIDTQASTGGPVGTQLSDTATLIGGASPTGTVTFRLFSDNTCATQVFTSTNAVSGGSATSGTFTPTATGTYFWTAAYSGDTNNDTATAACNAANESATVGKASPTINTQASAGGPVGTQVTDTATLSAGASPTGTVTFRLFSDNTCATQVFTSTNALSGGSATSGALTTTATGTYYWTAAYNGDANNNTATSACNAANEAVVITKATPTIGTQASAGGPIGTQVSDTATLSAGASPTGTVTFRLFSDNTCATQVFTSTNALSGGSATSGALTTTAAGTYYWTAVYNGDANNDTVTSACNAANESVTIAMSSPTIGSQASAGGPVGATSVTDTATVSGGFNATGTVTFRLFSNSTCATQVFTSTNVLSGGSATSGSFSPTAAGTYYWTAAYSGDNNNMASTSGCNATNESVVITMVTPTFSTQASGMVPFGGSVSDTATVSGGFGPTGTVTFRLFSDSACSSQVFTSTNNLSGGSATSGSFTPGAPGVYYWTASYSGDTNNFAVSGACGATNESVLVGKASPTLTTQSSPTGPIGSTNISDTATVVGGFNATGNVAFRLFSDASCASQVFASTNALSGTSATSGAFTPGSAGTYYWTAVYNGDANNNPATSACNATNESTMITKASPTISTQASAGGIQGTPVRDVATLAGGFGPPSGNVTFRLFSDNACGSQVFTVTNALAGGTSTSDWTSPAAPGTYYWTAVYNGDTNNNAATSPCNAPNESVAITPFQAPPFTSTVTGNSGPITVNAGQSVLITGAQVNGPVIVNPGGAVTVVNSKIANGLTANNPSFLSICGTDLTGQPSGPQALTVTNAAVPIRVGDTASGCAGNRFAGGVTLTGNLAVLFGNNQAAALVRIDNNGPGNTTIRSNTFFNTLTCSGNNPPPTNGGGPNTGSSKLGQCAGL